MQDMEQLLRLTKEDLRRELNANDLRVTLIIQLALTAGPIMFFAVILYLNYGIYAQSPPPPTSDLSVTMMLLHVTAFLTLGAIAAAYIVPSMMLKPAMLKKKAGSDQPVRWMTFLHRTLTIIRLAILEGAALLGLVVLIIASMGRFLDDNPVLWFAIVPMVIHVVASLLTLPTKSSVVEWMDTRILKPLQRTSGSF